MPSDRTGAGFSGGIPTVEEWAESVRVDSKVSAIAPCLQFFPRLVQWIVYLCHSIPRHIRHAGTTRRLEVLFGTARLSGMRTGSSSGRGDELLLNNFSSFRVAGSTITKCPPWPAVFVIFSVTHGFESAT